jgi:hypothetical protein
VCLCLCVRAFGVHENEGVQGFGNSFQLEETRETQGKSCNAGDSTGSQGPTGQGSV